MKGGIVLALLAALIAFGGCITDSGDDDGGASIVGIWEIRSDDGVSYNPTLGLRENGSYYSCNFEKYNAFVYGNFRFKGEDVIVFEYTIDGVKYKRQMRFELQEPYLRLHDGETAYEFRLNSRDTGKE